MIFTTKQYFKLLSICNLETLHIVTSHLIINYSLFKTVMKFGNENNFTLKHHLNHYEPTSVGFIP